MKHPGLTAKQVEESRQEYGANTLTQIPPEPLWKKISTGRLKAMDIVTNEFPFEQSEQAFCTALDDKENCVKCVIRLDDGKEG